MIENLQALLLAGGRSLRFNTEKTKLTEKICGKEMILYPLELLQRMNIPTTVVVGFQKEKIVDVLKENEVKNIEIAVQEEQLGTGHAVMVTEKFWYKDHIVIMNADIPLMTQDVIETLYKKHLKADADISFSTAHCVQEESDSYCKIVINDNKIQVIQPSEKSLDDSQCCISVGLYIMKKEFLQNHIHKLSKSTFTQEYYLPELIQIASNEGCKIVTTPIPFDLARQVNTLTELWVVEHIKRSQIIRHWMQKGVRFSISLNVIIDCDAILEPGVYIGSGVHILGKSVIKKNANIGAFAYITSSVIEQNAIIKPHTVITHSTIGQDAIINSFTQVNYQEIAGTLKKISKNTSPFFMGARRDDTKIDGLDFL